MNQEKKTFHEWYNLVVSVSFVDISTKCKN